MAAVLLPSGVQLLTLGIVGEYLWRLVFDGQRQAAFVAEVERSRAAAEAEAGAEQRASRRA